MVDGRSNAVAQPKGKKAKVYKPNFTMAKDSLDSKKISRRKWMETIDLSADMELGHATNELGHATNVNVAAAAVVPIDTSANVDPAVAAQPSPKRQALAPAAARYRR